MCMFGARESNKSYKFLGSGTDSAFPQGTFWETATAHDAVDCVNVTNRDFVRACQKQIIQD